MMTENLDVFFEDFGVDCIKPSSATVKVLIDVVDQEALGSMILSTDYKIIGKTSDLSDLEETNAVTVDGESYIVRKSLKIDDGRFMEVFLSKVES